MIGATLHIPGGDFVSVVGPSGSGKSTLLLMLGGMLSPSEGPSFSKLVGLRTAPSERAKMRREKVGFVFQTFNLVPYLSALENVQVPLFLAKMEEKAQKARATALLERVGLADRLDHKPGELSVGQQQRVALARMLANDPAVILADEPTGNLNPETSRQIIALSGGIQCRGENHRHGDTRSPSGQACQANSSLAKRNDYLPGDGEDGCLNTDTQWRKMKVLWVPTKHIKRRRGRHLFVLARRRHRRPGHKSTVDFMFRAFSDRTRLRILHALRDGELCVGDIVESLNAPQPRISRHLAYLRKAGLVAVRKSGLWSHYSLAPAKTQFHRKLLACLENCFGEVPEIQADLARAEKIRKSGGCCPKP